MSTTDTTTANAHVIAVFPDKVIISVENLDEFKSPDEVLRVGSYLNVYDNENAKLVAVIENFQIQVTDKGRTHIIEAFPLGIMRGDLFERGGDSLAIPPKEAHPALTSDIKIIYEKSAPHNSRFYFSKLSHRKEIAVPVDGNKFFNKHIAIVGSTGSGKSHTVAKIIQNATTEKPEGFSLNNSHVIIFDIHSEYKNAFPTAKYIDVSSLRLPYWLLSSEELEEFFIDTEGNDHNQRNIFKEGVINDRKNNAGSFDKERIHLDTPIKFDIKNVLQHAIFKNKEQIDTGEIIGSGDRKGQPKLVQGSLYGKLTNFINRLENKINDKRLSFFLSDEARDSTFEGTLRTLLGYGEDKNTNVVIIDLSGVPFEVLSITVSLISRLIFEYGYFYKKTRFLKNPAELINNDVPVLLVYEEAHKYVPNSDLNKYQASRRSIERIAKEGRKYGVTLMLASQRPSEISETIFAQCNNFIAMRLTNPVDQSYVKKLLPDSLGSLTDKMTSFKQGEALIVGESIILPSIVQIDPCINGPSSNDIPYWELWKEGWKDIDLVELKSEWYK